MFPGFSRVQGLCIVPNELLDLQVDPYTWSVLMYFARRVYRNGEPVVQVKKADIREATGIGENKLDETLSRAVERGYLTRTVSQSHEGNIYSLNFRDAAVTSTIDEPRTEGFKAFLTKQVKLIINDSTQVDKNNRPLTVSQRRLKAGLWAWDMIFGTNVPCDPKVMVEMIAVLGGSPTKVTKFLLRYAEREPWEGDEKADQKMLAILKGQLKRLGQAAEKRGGLGDKQERQAPSGRLPAFAADAS